MVHWTQDMGNIKVLPGTSSNLVYLVGSSKRNTITHYKLPRLLLPALYLLGLLTGLLTGLLL